MLPLVFGIFDTKLTHNSPKKIREKSGEKKHRTQAKNTELQLKRRTLVKNAGCDKNEKFLAIFLDFIFKTKDIFDFN